jgi:hypothetical protein
MAVSEGDFNFHDFKIFKTLFSNHKKKYVL